jgi:uncharacterized protein (DUF4415 family)
MPDYNASEPSSPSLLDSQFREAVTGPDRPTKIVISSALDEDVLAFMRSDGEPANWQQVANDVLRQYMDNCLQAHADIDRYLATVPAEGARP